MRLLANSFYLAGRYLCFHRWRTVILVLILAVIMVVPMVVNLMVGRGTEALSTRAEQTPLMLGAKGSALDLVMSGLYFLNQQPEPIKFGEIGKLDETRLGYTIPLHTAHESNGFRIVGTTLEYFDFRGLEVVDGGNVFGFLGEAVLGAEVAEKLGLEVGDSLISSSQNFIDLAGAYPLKMNVVGILQTAGTVDDDAIFVDVKTAWVISGLGHGHQDLAESENSSVVMERQDGLIMANAQLETYIEITPENMDSFHFHGEADSFPVHSAIVLPKGDKGRAMLLARYGLEGSQLQLVRPREVVGDLVDSIFSIKSILDWIVVVVLVATLLSLGVVMFLSMRLRSREFALLDRLGGSRAMVGMLIVAELVILLVASSLVAAVFWLLALGIQDTVLLRLLAS